MKKTFIFIVLCLLLILPTVLATERTVKTIEMPIGFAAATAANAIYIKQVNITMPDGYSKGLSFIIELTGDYPSVSTGILAKVRNNKTGALYDCNPVNVTTAAATNIRNYKATFDCTNVLSTISYGGGVMDLGFSTNKISNNIFGVMKLTYYNDPAGSMSLSGTEYSPGDPATMFVQLQNNLGNAVQNGSCYLDIWYPLNSTGAHPYTINDAPMLQALGDDGIYYYDMTAPAQLGVYMLSARCAYALNWQWIYPEDELIFFPTRNILSGTYIGSSQSLVTRSENIYERCTNAAATTCQATYTFNISQYGVLTNITNINVYYAGQSDIAGKTLTMAYWNGSTYVNAVNTLTYPASGATATIAGPVDEYLTNSIPATARMANGTVTIRLTTNTGLARFYNNWLALAILTSSGTIQDVKGSSEMHVTNIPNATKTLVNAETPAYVWNYTMRNLTYTAPTSIDYTALQGYVWNATMRNLTYTAPASVDYTALQGYVWNATNRNLTYYPNMTVITQNVTVQNVTVVTQNVTVQNVSVITQNVTVQNVTVNVQNVTVQNITVDYTAIQGYVWNASDRNLTYYPIQVDLTNYSLINLGVWTYTMRNLTYYPAQVDLTNYSQGALYVWNYVNRNLTYYPTTDYLTTAEYLWNFTGGRYVNGIII